MPRIIGLVLVAGIRFMKVRPMWHFKTSVDEIVEAPSDGNSFSMLLTHFSRGDLDDAWWWRCSGWCVLFTLVFVLSSTVILQYLDAANSTATNAEGPAALPPARALLAPRGLKSWPNSRAQGHDMWYCNDDDVNSNGCGTGYVARHKSAHRYTSAGEKGFVGGSGLGVGCATATMAAGPEMAPVAAVAGAGCFVGGTVVGFGLSLFADGSDDNCFPQCADVVPQVVKDALWCIPSGHTEMKLCGMCDGCGCSDREKKHGVIARDYSDDSSCD